MFRSTFGPRSPKFTGDGYPLRCSACSSPLGKGSGSLRTTDQTSGILCIHPIFSPLPR